MHITFVRAACAAAIAGIVASPAAAQGRGHGASRDRGFELGVDAGLSYTSTRVDGVTQQPPGTTSINFPTGDLRVAFPTSSLVAFELAGDFRYLSSNGDRLTSSLLEVGLPISLTGGGNSPDWFLRPAIGWQHSGQNGGQSFNRATLAAGIGLRVPVNNHISMRYELRDTYLAKSHGISGNVIGLLAGVSVYTR